MYRNAENTHWSVRAEFTINHPGSEDSAPQTHTERTDTGGVRMTYSWDSETSTPKWVPSNVNQSEPTTSRNETSNTPSQGMKSGQMYFSSVPPARPYHLPSSSKLGLNIPDSSGYGSDLFSPNSLSGAGAFHRPVQPYNRKCISTCNITLSSNLPESCKPSESANTQCGRTQSLRCQTPSLSCERKDSYYGCGDPWCHHLHTGDEFSCPKISPLLEACEDCVTHSKSSRSTLVSRCCRHARSASHEPENRRDACVQTYEMVDKCTSPFLKVDSFESDEKNKLRKERFTKTSKKRYSSFGRRKTEPLHQGSYSPSSYTPDSLESGQFQPPRRLTRSPKLKKIPSTNLEKISSTSDTKSSDNSKKPRTVHIDVYCTGTEMESDSSKSDSSDNATASTPQTVFESNEVRITHKRADKDDVPFITVKKDQDQDIGGGLPSPSILEKADSFVTDNQSFSSNYPSKMSSYSTFRDLTSSVSSVPQSWTNYSMSSCAIPEDYYDSVTNTSWKDTFSDLDSALQSRASMGATDSLDFVPKMWQGKNSSIDETPELERKDFLATPTTPNLEMSDSFEYANSEDKVRIKKMEDLWINNKTALLKPGKLDEKQGLKQKKVNQLFEGRPRSLRRRYKTNSKDSDSDDSAGEGWTFVKDDSKKLERDATIKRSEKSSKTHLGDIDQGSLSDSSPTSCKSPSTVALLEKLRLNPTLSAPFTIVPGVYTEPRTIAKKFGNIVNAVRKPGHHVGPVKNPECSCDHCIRHRTEFRSRTRSVGDPPSIQVLNWKEHMKQKVPIDETSMKFTS